MNMYLYASMEWTYAYVFVYVDCIFGKHTRIIGEVLVGESREGDRVAEETFNLV